MIYLAILIYLLIGAGYAAYVIKRMGARARALEFIALLLFWPIWLLIQLVMGILAAIFK